MAQTTQPTAIYPKTVLLRDGTEVVLRPLGEDDGGKLLDFFASIPQEERYYLQDNVASPEVVRHWTHHPDFERVIPIVALVDDNIVADGSLHRSPTPSRRHAGELRVVVHPDYRKRGLGARVIRELVDTALDEGLSMVYFRLVVGREDAAIQAAKGLGFVEAGVLHGAIKDARGVYLDVVTLELPIVESMWWRY